MHTVIPASRRRIPIAYFRACTWNLRGCFVKFLHPWYVLSALPIHVFVTYVCISHAYAYLLRSAQRSVANVRLATLTVNWTLKRRVFLKNSGAFPPLVYRPKKHSIVGMKPHRLFVERAPILRVCPMFCPAPLFSSCVHPIRYLHFYLLVRIAFIRHCLHFTSSYRVLHETTFIGEHTVESVNLKGSPDNSIDLVINDSEVPAGWRFQPINRIGIR